MYAAVGILVNFVGFLERNWSQYWLLIQQARRLNLGKSSPVRIKYFMRTYFIVGRVEEVYDFLVVELHELRHDFKFGNEAAGFLRFIDAALDAGEEVFDGAGDDADLFLGYLHVEAWAHRVCFARAGLTIRQNCGVVSIGKYSLSDYIFLFKCLRLYYII